MNLVDSSGWNEMVLRSSGSSKRTPAINPPQSIPPPTLTTSVFATPLTLRVLPVAAITTTPKTTAAVPSLKRLSASISNLSRPRTLASFKVAITETGSVAAIRAPKNKALIHSQPARYRIPRAVTSHDRQSPTVTSTRITGSSLRSSF